MSKKIGCKPGQIIVSGRCTNQKGTVYKKLPSIRGRHPSEKLMNFYRDIGWDGEQNIDPTKVTVNEKDWLVLIKKMEPAGGTHDARVASGWMFTIKGPSGSNKVKTGKVRLKKGWVN